MVRCICGNTRSNRVRNDDILERFGVALVEEKLVQHHLRQFGHIQWRPLEALICSGPSVTTQNSGYDRLPLVANG
jgi:hypothetical protein